MAETKSRARLLPLALGIGTALLYAVTLRNGLTNWDDLEYIENNPFAAKGIAGIGLAFTKSFDGAWYPLTHATYALLQTVAGGPSPLAHHLLQITLFSLTVALVPAALRAFKVPTLVGVLAAILWGVHPLHVEAVSWASNLKDTLSVLGVVTTFALLAREKRGWAALVFVGALLAKSTVFPLAFLVPISDVLRGRSLKQALLDAWAFVVPSIAVAVIAAICHLGAPAEMERSHPGGGLIAAIPTVIYLPWWYLARLAWPWPMQAIYDFKPVGWGDARLIVAAVAWAGAIAWTFTRAREQRASWFAGFAAWWLPFAAVTGLVPLGFLLADRYTLLPSLAVSVFAAWLLVKVAREKAAVAVVVVLAAVLAVPNVLRQRDWHDGVSLWEANKARTPDNWAVRLNLAGAYGGQGRWADAISELKALRAIAPEKTRVLGDLFFAQAVLENVPADAIIKMRERLHASGYRTEALLPVADEALANKAAESARLLLDEAQRKGPRADVEARLAKVEQLEGHYELVLSHATKAMEMNTALEGSRIDIIIALVELGRVDEAIQRSEQPARDPRVQGLLMGVRAYALNKAGRAEEARALLDAAKRSLQAQAAMHAPR